MSADKLHQDQIYLVIQKMVADGNLDFTPGHVADALRAAGNPMGTWQIRAVLTDLEAAGLITHDADRNRWALAVGHRKAAVG